MADLEGALRGLEDLEGVNGVFVVGRDGIVIEGASMVAALDHDTVGAVVSTAVAAADGAGDELGVGALALGMLEYGGGSLLITALGLDILLVVAAEDGAHLGSIRHQIKRQRTAVAAAL